LVSHISANQLFAPCVIDGVVQSKISSPDCIEADPAPFYNIAGQTGSIVETLSNGNMNYNGLQVSFRQRLSHGLEYTVNYTYAKALTDAVGFFQVSNINGGNNYPQNSYDPRAEYGPNGTDVRHSLNFHLVYDLPLGRNRMFGANMNRALDEVIGDWRVSLTGVGYTGFPVTLTAKNNAFTGNKWQHPNQYRPLRISHRSLLHWWGTDPSVTSCTTPGEDNGVCAYGQPADGTYGTGSIGSERAPGYQDFDASVSKSFSTFHEQSITFRADATNFLNHTSLGNPNSSITSSSFGTISSVRSGPRKLQLELKYLF